LISLSGLVVGSVFGVVSNQRNKCVLLAMRELTEPLQQFALVHGQFRAVETQAWLVAQRALLNQALLKASNDLGVHAAVMIFGNLIHAVTHAIR
jgi:hypothetical protein